MARKDYQEILEEEASKHGVHVAYHNRGAQWGRAALGSKRIFVPKPASFISFFTGLHELGHVLSGHRGGDGKPEYLWEFEAFTWAVQFCKEHSIHVPQTTISNERDIIAEKLKDEAKSGAKRLDPLVVRFVKEGGGDDPDVEFVKKHIADNGRVQSSNLDE